MRHVSFAPVALASALCVVAGGQDTGVHAPDGGTQEFLQSVFIAPLPNAPFRAVVRTEWTHILPDGSRGTTYNHRLVARDSSGRVFQERRFLSPHGDTAETQVSLLQYDDPNRHERILCYPQRLTCDTSPLFLQAMPMQPAGPLPSGAGTLERVDLGRQSMASLEVVGTREITTLKAGVFGNERPEPVIKEFWYSPRLGINIVTKRFDPRVSSAQNFNVTDINLTEPDGRLFQPPPNFEVLPTRR